MKCACCGSKENVIEHHVEYYPDEEKVPLCKKCHSKAHRDEDHLFHPRQERPEWWDGGKKRTKSDISKINRYLKGKIALTPEEISDNLGKSIHYTKKILATGKFKEVSGPHIDNDLWTVRNS